ncbi:hypothetical protein EPI10_005862 [Gossypium australe]|uniref:Uncharacterized protein n=1 Tax=Gossypium australe TaxID=47621 RepID=A0A5B6WR70_9ROSI|nr:hypothetical protein EPI10_005862 [Gossypium australe]
MKYMPSLHSQLILLLMILIMQFSHRVTLMLFPVYIARMIILSRIVHQIPRTNTRIEVDKDHSPNSIIRNGVTIQTFLRATKEPDQTTITHSIEQINLLGSINKFRTHYKLNHLIAYMVKNNALIQSQATTLKNLET